MFVRLALMVLLVVPGCGNALSGQWADEMSRTMELTDSGAVYVLDPVRYPTQSLAAIDPSNPMGYKFRGRFSTDGATWTLIGNDGVYPASVVRETEITTSFILDGDRLADDVLTRMGTGDGLAGTWQGSQTVVVDLVFEGRETTRRDTLLQLNADGSAAYTVTSTTSAEGKSQSSESLGRSGSWTASGDGAVAVWEAGSTGGEPTTERFVRFGANSLSSVVWTRP